MKSQSKNERALPKGLWYRFCFVLILQQYFFFLRGGGRSMQKMHKDSFFFLFLKSSSLPIAYAISRAFDFVSLSLHPCRISQLCAVWTSAQLRIANGLLRSLSFCLKCSETGAFLIGDAALYFSNQSLELLKS